MAIDTADKRRASIGFGMPQSAGTLIPSGATSAFRRGSGLGLYHIVASVAVVTTRLSLVGTSRQRLAVSGTSAERIEITGTSQKRLTIEGASL